MKTEINQRIGDYVDGHADELVGFLQTVVRSKSLWGDVPELAKLGKTIHSRLVEGGVAAEFQDSGTPGAPNVLGRVGERTGRNILLCGHFDVYPPSKAWSFDPWSGLIRGDKLYGAGSTDMKGGTTAMLMAATVLAALGEPKGGELVVLPIPNHFEGGEGTRRARLRQIGQQSARCCPDKRARPGGAGSRDATRRRECRSVCAPHRGGGR